MNYKKHKKEFFSNAETIIRREWIESAIACARARLAEPSPRPETADLNAFDQSFGVEANESSGPHLALVWSADERRSGT